MKFAYLMYRCSNICLVEHWTLVFHYSDSLLMGEVCGIELTKKQAKQFIKDAQLGIVANGDDNATYFETYCSPE